MSIIKVEKLTKDYGDNKGVFDVSLTVEKGEVYGFLGPNGSGKTTLIRHLLGFSKPLSGVSTILDMDCWNKPAEIQKHVGYIPGEIAFPDNMTGMQFIESIAELRGLKDLTKAKELIALFELDTRGDLKRMSKGMKQKIALVIAFMHSPEILILDEPTSGLDPLMQEKFVQLVKKEKASGNTIFMSSHMFEEVEKTCDRVAIIKQGRIIALVEMKDIEHNNDKIFEVKLKSLEQFKKFIEQDLIFVEKNQNKLRVKVNINDKDINKFLSALCKFEVVYLSEQKFTLEQYFMQYYKEEEPANV